MKPEAREAGREEAWESWSPSSLQAPRPAHSGGRGRGRGRGWDNTTLNRSAILPVPLRYPSTSLGNFLDLSPFPHPVRPRKPAQSPDPLGALGPLCGFSKQFGSFWSLGEEASAPSFFSGVKKFLAFRVKRAGLCFLVSTSKTQRSPVKWELDTPPRLSASTLLWVRQAPQYLTGQPGTCRKRSDPTQPWELETGGC